MLPNERRTCAKVYSSKESGWRKASKRVVISLSLPPVHPSRKMNLHEPCSKRDAIPIHGPLHEHIHIHFPLHGHLSAFLLGMTWYRMAPVCPLHVPDHPAVKHRGSIWQRCFFKNSKGWAILHSAVYFFLRDYQIVPRQAVALVL